MSEYIALRRLFRVVNGGTPTSDEANWNGDVCWATPADLAPVHGTSITTTARTITRAGLSSGSAVVPSESLLLSTRAPIGYVAATTTETAFNQGCRGLVPRTELDLRFFRYQLMARRADLVASGQGSTFTELSTDGLAAFKVWSPSPIAQRGVADFLDAETARIDALVEKKRRMVDALHRRWAVVRRNGVTIGIDANAPTRSTGISWLRVVPVHWRMSKLQHLADVRSGATPSTGREDYWDGDVPWVSPKDMKRFEIDSSLDYVTARAVKEVGLHLAEPGCVLFVVRGMILAHTFPVALNSVPVTINQDMKALRLKQDDSRFLAHLLAGVSDSVLALLVEESAHGTRVLRMDRWKEFPLFLPPLDEQRRIVRFLDDEIERVSAITGRISQQLVLLSEHRQALITAAVTGGLDVAKAVA